MPLHWYGLSASRASLVGRLVGPFVGHDVGLFVLSAVGSHNTHASAFSHAGVFYYTTLSPILQASCAAVSTKRKVDPKDN